MQADPASGLFTLQFTDSLQKRYRATRKHFEQFCDAGEELVLARGSGLGLGSANENILVSFASVGAAIRALRGAGSEGSGILGLSVAPACRPPRSLADAISAYFL
jgi:hypothetical protein